MADIEVKNGRKIILKPVYKLSERYDLTIASESYELGGTFEIDGNEYTSDYTEVYYPKKEEELSVSALPIASTAFSCWYDQLDNSWWSTSKDILVNNDLMTKSRKLLATFKSVESKQYFAYDFSGISASSNRQTVDVNCSETNEKISVSFGSSSGQATSELIKMPCGMISKSANTPLYLQSNVDTPFSGCTSAQLQFSGLGGGTNSIIVTLLDKDGNTLGSETYSVASNVWDIKIHVFTADEIAKCNRIEFSRSGTSIPVFIDNIEINIEK